jgi:poly(A) polymerase/tRNA nucleotidyltransferase (CCA-adding enzyme)
MQPHKNSAPTITRPSIPTFVAFILERLKHAGHQAFIVGGAVRNIFLQLPIVDWDITTSAQTKEIKTIFNDIRCFSLKHDTVTLVRSGRHFEVTTFKGQADCLEDDLARRDFTINAMALDPERIEILDPFEGRMDIRRKLIRAVGDPQIRFQEDPLRLLRAVRLATELGFLIETKTLETLTCLAPSLRKVAPERIREELIKVLMSPNPSMGFNLMRRTGLLKQFLPELLEGYRKRQNARHRHTIYKHIMETIDRTEPVKFLRLTALFHDIAKPRVRENIEGEWRFFGHEDASADLAAEILDRLRFPRLMIGKVTNLIRHHMIDYHSQWSAAAVRRLIRRVGPENIMDLMRFRGADIFAHGLDNQEAILLNELEGRIKNQIKNSVPTQTQDLAINGITVMEILGLSAGPEVGRILGELMEKVIDNPDLNTKSSLIAILEQKKPPDLL